MRRGGRGVKFPDKAGYRGGTPLNGLMGPNADYAH